MIHENDLRIGNWVFIDIDGKLIYKKIEGIILATKIKRIEQYSSPFIIYDGGTCVLQVDKQNDEYNWVKPIPLTEEILLKCGFITDKSVKTIIRFRSIYFYGNFSIELYKKSLYLSGYKPFLLPICFLHDLQNLYFAITSQELVVKL